MPPHPGPGWSFGARETLLTMPTVLGHHGHDFVHLLDRQQPAEGSAVSRLTAPLPARRRRFRARWCLGRLRRGGTRGIGRVLPQPGFQLADPLVQGSRPGQPSARAAPRSPDGASPTAPPVALRPEPGSSPTARATAAKSPHSEQFGKPDWIILLWCQPVSYLLSFKEQWQVCALLCLHATLPVASPPR